jgi:hypothetical protein
MVAYITPTKERITPKMKKDYHITKRPDGNWQYKQPGATRAAGITPTQSAAEQAAKTVARHSGQGGEITIHRPNGQIRDRDTISPANDPSTSRDTKH